MGTMRRVVVVIGVLGLAAAWGLIGCADRRATSDIETHPASWGEPTNRDFHGVQVLTSGTGSCFASTCHGPNGAGGAAGSCDGADCHPTGGEGGHPPGYVTGDPPGHGLDVAEFGPGECTLCHGVDYGGGWSGRSCFSCHAGQGPAAHPQGYATGDPPEHGLDVVALGPDGCAVCHGEDYGGGWSGSSCFSCHAGQGPAAHPGGYAYGDPPRHGLDVAELGPQACTPCHGVDYGGGWAGPSCFECHRGPGAHPRGWGAPPDGSNTNSHVLTVIAEGTEDCQRCHGEDLGGGTSGLACSECHAWPPAGR